MPEFLPSEADDQVFPELFAPRDALTHALGFKPGDAVTVDANRYRGPGVISQQTYWGSHIVWLDHSGVTLAVKIPNGNVWLYPALTVQPKRGP